MVEVDLMMQANPHNYQHQQQQMLYGTQPAGATL